MSRWTRILGGTSLALTLLLSLAAPGHGQGTGASTSIDVSPISSAMGGASNAVFWGEGTNSWANPALLGSERGVAYHWEHSRLVPGLANDVHIETRALRLGFAGIGLSISGQPPFGGRRLDYGRSILTDAGGAEIGTYASFETVDSWSFGVNAIEAADGLRGALGDRARSWSRYADLSFGMSFKDVVIQLAPAMLQGRARASNRDVGVLARFTPTELLDSSGDLPCRVDFAYGWSTLNYNDARFVFVAEDVASPATRHQRNGVAVRVAVDPASRTRWHADDGGGAAWFRKGFSPLFSLGLASDWMRVSAGGRGPSYGTTGFGAEVGIANVLALRMGHHDDTVGEIVGSTWGFGIGLPIGDLGGVRYDWASWPQSGDLERVTRHSVIAWLDPIAAWRATRAGRPGWATNAAPSLDGGVPTR